MPISWNEIKHRAMEFSREWQDETRERSESQSFWNGFFNIFGIKRRRVAAFEEPVKKLNNKYGFIDLFWKGTLLIEHKSRGEDLDKAYSQALDYFANLKEHELPKYVLVSDFDRFRLYDLDDNEQYQFNLSQLHNNVSRFGFIAGYTQKKYKEEEPVNIKAAELMGKLHDSLLENGYRGHDLEVYLMRLLFCVFADDTGIFEKNLFVDYIRNRTGEDGSDLGQHLNAVFETMNTTTADRQKNIDELLDAFPYVNGGLFKETLRTAYFDTTTRENLLECCDFEWGVISPAIFGSMFQSVMNPKERRELGAHYTTEKNILKLIEPLFLDELKAEFEHIKNLRIGKAKRLEDFHHKIADLGFFDPACGCGNFLVVTYRELRRLEMRIIEELDENQKLLGKVFSLVNVEQFYGIEIEEFPARIAETAMWLMDHQMNIELQEKVNFQRASLPLIHSAHIKHGNALQIEWEDFAPKNKINYILGNPPFIGKKEQNKKQKNEIMEIFAGVKGCGVLDYVTAWYLKASRYVSNSEKKVAFVSTNSITMGEQVGILWNELFNNYNIKIHFAHRTFNWSSEARGKAAVHVVIIGFAAFDTQYKQIFEYEDIKGEPHQIQVNNINPYLTSGSDTVILKRSKPLSEVPLVQYGSIAIDNGHLIIDETFKDVVLSNYPEAQDIIKPYIGSYEFLNNKKRWCLWFDNNNPGSFRQCHEIIKRIELTKIFRESSSRKQTKELAHMPYLFGEIRQPNSEYILIPKVSSERRNYIPLGFCQPDYIANGSCLIVPNASFYAFGVLSSLMHMAWIKYVAGRMKSDFQYSAVIVYNNYPWPENPDDKQLAAVESAAQAVFDERAKHPGSSLADLYDPLTMPPGLVKAHNNLDRAVDKCYRREPFNSEMERLEFLFALYNKYTQPLIKEEKKKRKKRK